MKKLLPVLAILALSELPAGAQTPTWADDIATILYNNCTKCHNPSGIAPFSLMTYSDAVNNSGTIQAQVVAKTMPPWPPDPNYRHFAHERLLSAADIQAIDDWVNGGTPQGNMANAPTPPVYTGTAQLTNPNLTAQIPTYTHSSPTDDYRCFVIPSGQTTAQYITDFEVIPGNRNIVHHVLIYQDLSNTCVNLDNADPNPGYTSFGGVGSATATLIGGWVPGQEMYSLPPNMGIKLLANAKIIVQMHYPGVSAPAVDSTKILFRFASGTVRQVYLSPVLNYWSTMTNGPLVVPANQTATFHEQYNVSGNMTLISVAPHMHLLGQTISVWGVTPAQDTIPVIDIPAWDFHWQGFYNFPQLQFIPSGTVMHSSATYDNTTNNPENPNSPPQTVTAGEATTDEMMVTYFAYANYQAGDENIIIDSAAATGIPNPSYGNIVQTPQLYDPYPSPAGESATGYYFLPSASRVTLELYDINGRKIAGIINGEQINSGIHYADLPIEKLSAGMYVLRLQAGDAVRTKKFVKK